MTLEITVDPDTEEINIILDSSIVLSAYKNIEGQIVYSNSFNKLIEDDLYDSMKAICNTLLNTAI